MIPLSDEQIAGLIEYLSFDGPRKPAADGRAVRAFRELLQRRAQASTPETARLREAFIDGYERGREDEVWRAESRADEWLERQEQANG